jgi:multidrug transporter EmrE-like cation transporter
MYWPIALIVLSNICYHICSKQVPQALDPMASLTVTYAVGAVTALIMYFALNRGAGPSSLVREYSGVNWTSFVLGVAIVGLEVGCIYMYRAGWNINTGYMFESAIFAVALLFIGKFLFGEELSLTKIAGVGVCLAGLWLMKR